ncbi:MAG: peptidase dimerization domain-containing protein [Terriglobia bacterium]
MKVPAAEIRKHNPEWAAMLQFTLSPTMLNAGIRINVIPNTAEAQVDGRRLPGETRDEIFARLTRIIGDPAVSLLNADTVEHPATDPSSLTSPLCLAMEEVFTSAAPGSVVVPYLVRATTDGAYLRAKGVAFMVCLSSVRKAKAAP